MASPSEDAVVGWIGPDDRPWLADLAVPRELESRILEGFRLAVWRSAGAANPRAWLAATIQAGGVGFLDPPGAIGELTANQAESLLAFVVAALGSEMNLAQLMLPMGAELVEAAALKVGFRFGADLLLLGRSIAGSDIEPLPEMIRFEPCGEELAQVLTNTYEATKDCPLLTGRRPISEVLKGYESTGASGRKHWRTLFVERRAVGCVLVAVHAQLGIAELVYMGLVADARGQGLGPALLIEAEKMTQQAGLSQLVIGVDAANAPARRIYESAGYMPWDQKKVWLWFPGANLTASTAP